MSLNGISERNTNRENVLTYIYIHQRTTQKAIREALQLSRSTILQILKEFEESGIVVKKGHLESTGGRRAATLRFSNDYRIAVGIELLAGYFEVVALDLYGETIKRCTYNVPYENSARYYQEVCASALQFIESMPYEQEKILGVGIVLQGLISKDGKLVTYGKILNCTGLRIEEFSKYLPYPCKFYHDAEAAFLDELWQSPTIRNAFYVNIRSNMSGALVVNRKPIIGDELKSGVFEHMTVVPNGKPCYCGKRGCLDAYCSTQALLDEGETLESFFQLLRMGNQEVHKRWIHYLQYLARAINNLRLIMDCPVILGGTMAKYLHGNDIKTIHQLVNNIAAFPTERKFIEVTACPGSPISRGAAIAYIKEYLYKILGTETDAIL